MADNTFYGNQKIHVVTDYDNVIVIDPNKIVNPDGTVEERLVNHENLISYANLEARIIPRTKLAIGSNYNDSIRNVGVAQLKLNFLDGKKQENQNNAAESFNKKYGIDDQFGDNKYFDTTWTDQILPGGVTTNEQGNQTYSIGGGINSQLFGINKINIKISAAFVPQVTIEMTDVQGRVLFERADESPYSFFMQLPYPIFILTLKGYYGKAIKFELMLKSFNARFDPTNGNYSITTIFIARTHAFLQDTLLDYLYTVPHMYPKMYEIGSYTGANNDLVPQETATVTKGYEKLREVYSIYKSKGLISDDFPELTLNQMSMRLDYFNRYIMEAYSKEDMSVLNDIVNFNKTINNYRRDVYVTTVANTWAEKYVDINDFYILKDKNKPVIYGLKKEFKDNSQKQNDAISALDGVIKKYNTQLENNPTFCQKGTYVIEGKETPSKITINISDNDIIINDLNLDNIDYKETCRRRLNRSISDDSPELIECERRIRSELEIQNITIPVNDRQKPIFITFGNLNNASGFYERSFMGKITTIRDKFDKLKVQIETELSEALSKKVISSDVGLGFVPTINNVLAVIVANAEAFYRLMDEVHDNAWEVRSDKDRISSIIGEASGINECKGIDPITNESIIYPWPQYVTKNINKNGDEEWNSVYPGLPSEINRVKGWDYTKWPEIEFVEEYLIASLERDEPVMNFAYNNELTQSNYISSNAIEFPFNTLPYVNEEQTSFMYEIFERTYLSSNYTKINRNNNFRDSLVTVFSDFESNNIKEGVLNSPGLTKILKENKFNSELFGAYLSSISNNGQGSFYSRKVRDIYTQPYIQSYVDVDYGIYNIDTISTKSIEIQSTTKSVQTLKQYITGTSSNGITFLDVFPFNNLQWEQNNLAKGENIGEIETANETNKVMSFNEFKKTLATFNDNGDANFNKTNKYLTYFDFITNNFSSVNQTTSNDSFTTDYNTNDSVITYFNNREKTDLFLSEGILNYGNSYDTTTNKLTPQQTNSLINTPYFINAIQKGVEKETNGNENPYVGLGYLYLNSLPLSTLSEKYITQTDLEGGVQTTTWSNYIFAGLTKFAAIHKIPYLWILKYGSIWHRYKEEKMGNGDILDGIWQDFDYTNAYDPIGGNINKTYQVRDYTGGTYTYNTQKLNTTQIGEELRINNGFYPQVINDVYKFFTEKTLFTGYTNTELTNLFDNGKFKMGISQTNILPKGYDESNTGRTMNYYSWFQYFDIDDNSSFDQDAKGKLLIIPSSGYLKFTQSQRECLNKNNVMIQDITNTNTAIQNGNVRTLWGSPNFGYFNNSWVKKPETNEYLKVIDNTRDQQAAFNLVGNDTTNGYKSIEDIFAVFSKEMLDEFEKHFLNFCKKDKNYTSIVYNPIKNDDGKTYEFNIESVMKTLLFVDKTDILGVDSFNDSSTIAKNQMLKFVNRNSEWINDYDVILKIGNPGGFNRRAFNSFSSNLEIRPIDPIIFGNYVPNSLPTSTNTTTLSVSQSNYPEEWEALYLYVGDYVEEGMRYSDNGSPITDFFEVMNIEFTSSNIKNLSKIIKVFATQKYNNNALTKSEFYTSFENFLLEQSKFQDDLLNQIFSKLNQILPTVSNPTTEGVSRISKLDGDINKNELWYTFKNFNDRWISGQDVKYRTLFEEFLFLDKRNVPIGNDVIINIEDLRYRLRNTSSSESILSLISYILTDNNFIYMPTPTYANFYGRNQRVKEGMPDPSFSDIAGNAFGTFLEVDTHGSEPKFLAIYVGKTSEYPNVSNNNKDFLYCDDSFDITKPSLSSVRSSEDGVDNFSDRNKVVAFNLDFGIKNQNMFKSISIDMAQRKNIAPTFQINANLGSMADGQKVAQQTISLYEFYRNSSYTCSVTSMGNAMIQPTMYFNLQYVPMFYGPYLIINVTHDISSEDFITTFEGVRVSKYSLKMPDNLISSVNRNIVQNYISEINRMSNVNDLLSGTQINALSFIKNSKTSNTNKGSGDEGSCVAIQRRNVDYVALSATTITQEKFRELINNNTTLTENEKKYIFGVGYVESQNLNDNYKTLSAKNYNFFNLKNIIQNKGWTIPFKKQVCVKDGQYSIPYIAFDSSEESIKFMSDVCDRYESIFVNFLNNNTINGDLAKTYTYVWYYTLRYSVNNADTTGSGNSDDVIIATVNNEIQKNDDAKSLFDSAYDIFKRAIAAW